MSFFTKLFKSEAEEEKSNEESHTLLKYSLDDLRSGVGEISSILARPHKETIMYRAILAKKLAVNSNAWVSRDRLRYLLVSDQRIYTLEPEKIDAGVVIKSEVIVKTFDMSHLKQIIFICDSRDD